MPWGMKVCERSVGCAITEEKQEKEKEETLQKVIDKKLLGAPGLTARSKDATRGTLNTCDSRNKK